MARRRQWESLTENYRKRLTRNGITKSAYESGAPLTKARGHTSPQHEAAGRARRKAARRLLAERSNRVWNGEAQWTSDLLEYGLKNFVQLDSDSLKTRRINEWHEQAVEEYSAGHHAEASALYQRIVAENDMAEIMWEYFVYHTGENGA